ncbi:MAG: polysaccharide biosynthesis C-terminal domain-containing protein [Flavobacteriales bacterium]
MGIIIKQGLKTSIASYLGFAVGAFNNIYLFPKFIGPEGIGLLNLINASALLFLPVLNLGFVTSISKFYPKFRDKPYFTSFLGYALVLPLISFLIFVFVWPFTQGIFEFIFKSKSQIVFENIFWVLPLIGLLLVFGLFEAFSRANYKVAIPNLIRSVYWRVLMGIIVVLIASGFIRYDYLVPLLVFSWFVMLVFLIIYTLKVTRLKFSLNASFRHSQEIRKFNSFSGYVILLATGGVLIQKIDQLMVGGYLGTESAGVLTLSMYFATLIEIPRRSIMQIIQPVLADSFHQNDMKNVDEMYKKSSLNLFLIGGVLFLLVWINVFDIYEIIPRKEEFKGGIYVVFFYGLARVIDMGMGCNNEILVYSKHYKANLPMQLALVAIVVVTNWALIPRFDITGAALATCISVFTYNIIRFVYLWKKIGMQPFSKSTLQILFILSIAFIIGLNINFGFHPILNIILRSSIIIFPLVALLYFLKISKDINRLLDKVFKQIFIN